MTTYVPFYCSHIRGKVQPGTYRSPRTGDLYYSWQVVNLETDSVINSDNCCCSLAEAVSDCAQRVFIARRSLQLGFAASHMERKYAA